jgi:1-acyl-sn-glycerol-3-phosphate acyltransferase
MRASGAARQPTGTSAASAALVFAENAVLAVRSALFDAFFYGMTFFATIFAGVPVMAFAPARTLDLARWWARVNMRALSVICGIELVVSGREHLAAEGPILIAAQHQSAFDTIVWLALLPRCCYVLKRELTRIPLFGRLLTVSGMIAIDRAARIASLHAIIREGRAAVTAGRQIVIFPEGTRAEPGSVLPLHPGVAALAAGLRLPVIPAVTDSGRLWGRGAFYKRPGVIRLAILPPIRAGIGREALMERLKHVFMAGPDAVHAVDKTVDQPSH